MKNPRENIRLIAAICAKELRDHLRDKRSVALSLVFPLMAPVVIAMLMMVLASPKAPPGKNTSAMSIPVAGAERAPHFIDWLKAHGARIVPLPDDGEAAGALVRYGRQPFVVAIKKREETRSSPGIGTPEPLRMDMFLDRNQPRSLIAASDAMALIGAYGRAETERKLAALHIDAAILQPVLVRERNMGRNPGLAQLFYNMVPSLLIFMIFMGAVYVAIDITVGERERGSLEPLLSAPVDRGLMLFAKTLTAFIFSCGVVAVNLAAFAAALNWVHLHAPNLSPPPGNEVFLLLFLAALPLIALAVTIQMCLAMLTRSAKEAQIYLGLLPILPMIPGLMLMFTPNMPGPANATLPVYGHLLIFLAYIRGDPVPLDIVLLGAAGCIAFAGVIFALASSLFQRERTVFGS